MGKTGGEGLEGGWIKEGWGLTAGKEEWGDVWQGDKGGAADRTWGGVTRRKGGTAGGVGGTVR